MASAATAAAAAAAGVPRDTPTVLGLTEIPQTSLAARGMPPGEVTVQFRKYTAHGMTAYQKGQFAGFMPPAAQALVASGHAVIVVAPATRTVDAMVTK